MKVRVVEKVVVALLTFRNRHVKGFEFSLPDKRVVAQRRPRTIGFQVERVERASEAKEGTDEANDRIPITGIPTTDS